MTSKLVSVLTVTGSSSDSVMASAVEMIRCVGPQPA